MNGYCSTVDIRSFSNFFGPDDLEVAAVVINGVRRPNVAPDQYQIKLDKSELGSDVLVELRPTEARNQRNKRGSGG